MRTLLAAALLVLVANTGNAEPRPDGLIPLEAFPKTTLEIKSGTQKHVFDIWLAQTPEEQEQGLMFVRDLPENRGMLFVSATPRVFNMWMKNTYIPLDMVFIGKDGRIAKIAERTVPHSLATISSDVPVAAILEIKGGEARRRALHAGDSVQWAAPHSPSQ
jgi:uncharacterized membrane protein (UPF0127 family)